MANQVDEPTGLKLLRQRMKGEVPQIPLRDARPSDEVGRVLDEAARIIRDRGFVAWVELKDERRRVLWVDPRFRDDGRVYSIAFLFGDPPRVPALEWSVRWPDGNVDRRQLINMLGAFDEDAICAELVRLLDEMLRQPKSSPPYPPVAP